MNRNKLGKEIKFIDLSKFGFVLEPRYYFYGWAKTPKVYARESALNALMQARKFLPEGYNFKIWDGQRPYEVQMLMLDSIYRRIKFAHPEFSEKECREMAMMFGGKTTKHMKRLDTHQNGGSFDLMIVDSRGNELYMGTDHDDLTEKAATNYFEKKTQLNIFEKEAKKNRRILKQAMEKAGFMNFAPEWWHWSCDK